MNPIVELVREQMNGFQKLQQKHREIFPNQNNLYPIPFFGDLRRAKVLTLSLNPSPTEFHQGGHQERHWPHTLDAYSLTTRLLHYFDLPVPPPHGWFHYRDNALNFLDCSYNRNVAHVDLHPFPTKLRAELTKEQRKIVGRLIETNCNTHLANILQFAPQLTLVLVVDYSFSRSDGTTTKTFDFVSTNVSQLGKLVSGAGFCPPIFRAGGPTDFEIRVREHADVLRKHLQIGKSLSFCRSEPLRLFNFS